jgi:DNA-binding FadR family transcriptional regulator
MTSPLRSISRKSLVSEAIDILRAKVNDGAWKSGDRIPPEAVLAEQLGIGRNTLRQAIGVLSQSELLEVRQGDGTYVRRSVDPAETMEKLNDATLLDQLEVHRMLEGEVARCAALRRTDADLLALRALLDARGEAALHGQQDVFYANDRAFHLRVAEAAHNGALLELYRYFSASSEDRMRHLVGSEAPEMGTEAHESVYQAIAQRNAYAAAAAAQSIFDPLLAYMAAAGR